jgi:hypothetical protein
MLGDGHETALFIELLDDFGKVHERPGLRD